MFAISMIASSIIGGCLGLTHYTTFFITFPAAILASTLIASSILTLRDKHNRPSGYALAASSMNALNAVGLITAGAVAINETQGFLWGFHAEDYFFLSAMAIVAMLGDARYFLRNAHTYQTRVARHLWRMCTGFFIAAGSAFTGPGSSAFPQQIQDSGLLSLPELTIFLLMLFWLVKVAFFNGHNKLKSAAAARA